MSILKPSPPRYWSKMPTYGKFVPDLVIVALAKKIMQTLHIIYPKIEEIFEVHNMHWVSPNLLLSDYLQLIETPIESLDALSQEIKDNPINQLLLYGLTYPLEEWSSLYCKQLILLTRWLSDSIHPEMPGLMEFKQSYPPLLLSNLCFMALIKSSSLGSEMKKLCLEPFAEMDELTLKSLFFKALLNLNLEQVTKVLDVSRDNLGTLIQNGYMLTCLMMKSLDDKVREQIWTDAPFKIIIHDVFELITLFKLSPEQLSISQRTRILTSLTLDKIIQNAEQLESFLALFPTQLNKEHHEKIRLGLGNEEWFKQTFFGAAKQESPLKRSSNVQISYV